jgi:hypothetical protein
MDDELRGDAPSKDIPARWWVRGYLWDSPGAEVTCLLCGATVSGQLTRDSDGKPFWQVHDEWHEALDGR